MIDKIKKFLKKLNNRIESELRFWMPSSKERYESTNKGRYPENK